MVMMAGMKVFLAATLLLCVLCVGASIPTRDSIMMDAHKCCALSCSSQERELLEKRVAMYAGDDADNVKAYYSEAISGAACSSHDRKRASSSYLSVPYGPYDVGTADAVFNVVYNITQDSGISYSYIYAYSLMNSKTVYPQDYYYGDTGNNATFVARTVKFTIPQYSPYGNWSIVVYSYGYASNSYISNAGMFNVIRSTNDVSAPNITSISAPVLNLNDNDRYISFTAVDDLSGIDSVQIYLYNTSSGSTVAYGSYYVPSGTRQLSVSSAVTYFYNYTVLVPGTYDISCYVYDRMGSYRYYSTAQLKAMGLQSQVIIAVGYCKAGRKLAYGATGSCTLCDKGTFSNQGAFRCKACLPGTASNVAGATSCTQCPPGTAGIGGSAGCEICPAGTYTNSFGNAQCYPCAPGTNSTDGTEYCSSCPPGQYSLGGTATCTPCAAGTAASYGNYYCDPCLPGYYMPSTGASQCMLCPVNTFSWTGAISCTPCPAPTTVGPAGSNSRLNCQTPP